MVYFTQGTASNMLIIQIQITHWVPLPALKHWNRLLEYSRGMRWRLTGQCEQEMKGGVLEEYIAGAGGGVGRKLV